MSIVVDTDHSVTNKAIDIWGVPFQVGILQEETLELALNLQWMKRDKVTLDQIAEECADVLVSMMSVIPALGIENEVKNHMAIKLNRLLSRITDNGNKEELQSPLRGDTSAKATTSSEMVNSQYVSNPIGS